jgi:hypothetical protein
MDMNSLFNSIHSAGQALWAELVSAQLAADSSTLTSVMDAGCKKAGMYGADEIQLLIKTDPAMILALNSVDAATRKPVRAATRLLMDAYAGRVFREGHDAQFAEWQTRIEDPVTQRLPFATTHVDAILTSLEELKHQAARLQSLGINSGPSTLAIKEYDTNIEFVGATALKLSMYDSNIQVYTKDIDTLIFSGSSAQAKLQQGSRSSMIAERKFVEATLLAHFDVGSTHSRGDTKIALKELKIPEALEKGKGVELIQSVKAFMKNRAPQYYAIMSDIIRILAESKIGKFYKPADAKNGFAEVRIEIRGAYILQARELYDEICMKVPKAIMNDIRVSFKYGLDDSQACCSVGDGPMAIFCLLALFRPAGLAYRDSLRAKLEQGSQQFKGGSNPAAKIKELRQVILEAIALNVRVAWRTTGKGIVPVMSERGNNFAQILAKYNVPTGINDPEDCIIELNRMFTDIEETISNLEESGIDIKRLMAINVLWRRSWDLTGQIVKTVT